MSPGVLLILAILLASAAHILPQMIAAIGLVALATAIRSRDWLAGAASICMAFVGYGTLMARMNP